MISPVLLGIAAIVILLWDAPIKAFRKAAELSSQNQPGPPQETSPAEPAQRGESASVPYSATESEITSLAVNYARERNANLTITITDGVVEIKAKPIAEAPIVEAE